MPHGIDTCETPSRTPSAPGRWSPTGARRLQSWRSGYRGWIASSRCCTRPWQWRGVRARRSRLLPRRAAALYRLL